jgi:hypothetical protein
MNHQDTIAAVLTVGGGRGCVVEADKQRLVITAAHCLPYFPPCASISQLEDRTYQALLGQSLNTSGNSADAPSMSPVWT